MVLAVVAHVWHSGWLRLWHRESLLAECVDVGGGEAAMSVAVVGVVGVGGQVTSGLLEVCHVVAVEGLVKHYLVLLVLHLDLCLVKAELLKELQLLLLAQVLIQ